MSGLPAAHVAVTDFGFYYVALALFVLALIAFRTIVRSPFGRTLVAIRQNEPRVRYLGLNTDRFIFVALLISSTMAGLQRRALRPADQLRVPAPARLAPVRLLRALDDLGRRGHGVGLARRRVHLRDRQGHHLDDHRRRGRSFSARCSSRACSASRAASSARCKRSGGARRKRSRTTTSTPRSTRTRRWRSAVASDTGAARGAQHHQSLRRRARGRRRVARRCAKARSTR